MKYHILLGILLWTVAAVLAQNSKPAGDAPFAPESESTTPALKEKPSSHGKSGKPAAPLAKPEFGDEDEIQEDPDEDEEGPDCEGCLLAGRSQSPVVYAVRVVRDVTGSAAPRLSRFLDASDSSSDARSARSVPEPSSLTALASNTI